MMNIDRLEIRIKAYRYDNSDNSDDVKDFGRRLNFKKGLNLVVGDNTTGKTSLVKCLYYVLGMEELIDGKTGAESMDKSVSSKFIYKDSDGQQHEWFVVQSAVYVQLRNEEGEVLTIRRYIKIDNLRSSILHVWEKPLDEISDGDNGREYYVHSMNDHDVEYNVGFYGLLSKFTKLPIQMVPARNNDNGTKLYLQTLYSLMFIEQTRGWSDFLANIRSFNIYQPKQKVIEYAMNYSDDGDPIKAQRLKDKKKEIEKHWTEKVQELTNYLSYNSMFVEGLSIDISKQVVELESLRYAVREQGEFSEYRDMLIKRMDYLEKKQKAPVTSLEQNGYKELVQTYEEHKKNYEAFCVLLAEDQQTLLAMEKQLQLAMKEINRYNSLAKVNNIVTNLDVRQCPTCHQVLPISENAANHFCLTSNQIENNKKLLDMQRKFLKPMIEKLRSSIKSKELNRLYLENQLSLELERLKAMAADSNVNLNPLSVQEQFDLVDAKTRLTNLSSVKKYITSLMPELAALMPSYKTICQNLSELKGKSVTNPNHYDQLKLFREYLRNFGYSSNNINSIHFKEDAGNYKYFPVVQHTEDIEEEIRSDSSASDFIRSIWAYYLSILSLGVRHPGVLVMDEPCQHSMKESSLRKLFEVCSQLEDKQIILFCSSQPHTEETLDNTIHTSTIIKQLVDSLNSDSINYLSIENRAIDILE